MEIIAGAIACVLNLTSVPSDPHGFIMSTQNSDIVSWNQEALKLTRSRVKYGGSTAELWNPDGGVGGAAMRFIPDLTSLDKLNKSSMSSLLTTPRFQSNWAQILVLDSIVQTIDRQPKNCFFTDSKPVALDNGNAWKKLSNKFYGFSSLQVVHKCIYRMFGGMQAQRKLFIMEASRVASTYFIMDPSIFHMRLLNILKVDPFVKSKEIHGRGSKHIDPIELMLGNTYRNVLSRVSSHCRPDDINTGNALSEIISCVFTTRYSIIQRSLQERGVLHN